MGPRAGPRAPRARRRQRRHREGGRVVSDHGQEEPPRAGDRAREPASPIVYLVDSAGVFLPMQDEIFPDRDPLRAALSATTPGCRPSACRRSPPSWGAASPAAPTCRWMSDESLHRRRHGLGLSRGSVPGAGGHRGGDGRRDARRRHGRRPTSRGVIDYKVADDAACLQTVRDLIQKQAPRPRAGFGREAPRDPDYPASEIAAVFPEGRQTPLRRPRGARPPRRRGLVDGGQSGLRPDARLRHGPASTAGPSASWRASASSSGRRRSRASRPRCRIGGVIYGDAADKAARFVMQCNQKRIPLLFLQDVTGFHGRHPRRAVRHHQGTAPSWSRPSPTRSCPSSPSSSATRTGRATTRSAGAPTTRASSLPGPAHASPSWAARRPPRHCSRSRSGTLSKRGQELSDDDRAERPRRD